MEEISDQLRKRNLDNAVRLAIKAAKGNSPLTGHFMELGHRFAHTRKNSIQQQTDTSPVPFSFKGKDVCLALGYANPTDAMKAHCRGLAKRYPLQTQGGIQEIRVLAEPDVLRLIMKSKLPAAQAFEAMVFEEILPTIRKTGWWGEPVTSIPPRLTARQVREAVVMLRSFTYVNRITGMEKNQALLAANRRVQENTGINLLQQTGATHLLANDTDHH